MQNNSTITWHMLNNFLTLELKDHILPLHSGRIHRKCAEEKRYNSNNNNF